MAHWKKIKKMGWRCVTEKGKLTKSKNCPGTKGRGKAKAKGKRRSKGTCPRSKGGSAVKVKAHSRHCPKR